MTIDIGELTGMIDIGNITDQIQIRSVKPKGVERIRGLLEKHGFLENHPILVRKLGKDKYQLLDGAHRLEAARGVGLRFVPAHVVSCSAEEALGLARRSNEAAESVIPTTFVDDAELVWRELESGRTQQALADALGWSRSKVSNYAALEGIHSEAWEIVATAFQESVADGHEGGVATVATGVAFSEFLLRDILNLYKAQQIELCSDLAAGNINKNKFRKRAQAYLDRNNMEAFAVCQLEAIGDDAVDKACAEIAGGHLDGEWTSDNKPGPKLVKLVESLKTDWEKANSCRILYGDFMEESEALESGSIDLIVTDPPYNISKDGRKFTAEGKSDISHDFGEWDKQTAETYLENFDAWAAEWHRLLRLGGTLVACVSDRFQSHCRDIIESMGFQVRATLYMIKSNPAPNPAETIPKSGVEVAILATVPGAKHTYRFKQDNERNNYRIGPICHGNERITDHKGETLHPCQKPEWVAEWFIEQFSNPGDTVFDGFCGVGTFPAVAKRLGRKAIGIEIDARYHDAAQRRCAAV